MLNGLVQNRFFLPALFLLAVGIQFSGILLNPGSIPSYRDSTHFYFPLFQFLHAEFQSGCVPLWNPYQNLGVPLAANATTALFYPPTWILALPLPCWLLYNLYIIGHVVLAGAGIGFCCRRWNRSPDASFVAAVSYSLGAIVLFQHTNLIYLVSSAWLPLAFWATESALRRRSVRGAVLAGVFVALIILGGDVQAAYHWGIVAGILIAVRLLSFCGSTLKATPNETPDETPDETPNDTPNAAPGAAVPSVPSVSSELASGQILSKKPFNADFTRRICKHMYRLVAVLAGQLRVLAIAGATAGVLAAVQIVPLLEWANQCEKPVDRYSQTTNGKVRTERARLSADSKAADSTSLSNSIEPTFFESTSSSELKSFRERQAVRYQFSVPPWRVAEFVWGNVGGRQFPEYRRWSDLITGQDLTCWTVSLYMGAVPFLLALSGWGFRRAGMRRRSLSVVLVLALLASFGYFGLGFLIESLGYWSGDETATSESWRYWGTFYGWLGTVCPGYSEFRYPGKWLPTAALAVSLLAGLTWDRVWSCVRSRRRLERLVLLAFAVGLALAILAEGVFRNYSFANPDGSSRFYHSLYGPFAGYEPLWLFSSAGSLLIVGGLLAWNRPCSRRGLAILVLVDLLWFNQWLVPTVKSELLTTISVSISGDCSASAFRSVGDRITVPEKREESEPKMPPGFPVRVYRTGKDWIPDVFRKTSSVNRESELAVWNRESLFALNSTARECATSRYNGTRMLKSYADWLEAGRRRGRAVDKNFCPVIVRLEENQLVWRKNPTAVPFVWIPQQVTTNGERSANEERVANGERVANEGRGAGPDPTGDAGFSFQVTRYTCNWITVHVQTDSPTCLALAQQYYPGWRVWMGPNSAMNPQFQDVLRVDGTFQGIFLPAPGDYELHFLFLPLTILAGAGISLFGWLVCVPLLASGSRKRGSQFRRRSRF